MSPPAKKQKTLDQNESLEDFSEQDLQSMEILNNDCLLRIFSYLKMRELVALETMSTRFQDLVQYTYRKYKVFDVNEEGCTTNAIAKVISTKIGPYVRTLRAHDDDFGGASELFFTNSMLSIILENCPKIEHLDFEWIDLNGNDMLPDIDAYVKRNIPCHIKSIKFKGCGEFFDSDDDQWFQMFTQLQELESVDLSYNYFLDGTCLLFLKNLKEINLDECRSIEPEHFIEFCKNNRSLIKLNFVEHRRFDQECINAIGRYLTDLEVLNINSSDFPHDTNLAPLKKLLMLKSIDAKKLEDVDSISRAMRNNLLTLLINLNRESDSDSEETDDESECVIM
ncbi:hypothetical protein DMENIID0001_013750 [Sergentomyia squamirostris]